VRALEELDRLARERSARELSALQDQIERTGGCERPVRLRAQGPGSPSLGQPDGVLLVACKSRRETRCRPCSVTYRADAKQIVRTGIEGGKGVPGSVAGHPALFLTLTAPSFGAVHRSTGTRCHAGPPGRCEHGRPTWCLHTHNEDEEAVGTPLCPDCYDYEAAVVFNATVGELWRRVTIYARRHLAYVLGLTERDLAEQLRLSYVKVAELQRRGVVHLHAIVRADSAERDELLPPGIPVTPGLLTEALVRAVRAVSVTREVAGRNHECAFGEQIRAEPLAPEVMANLAGYLSKYLVKEASGTGALDHRLREGELEWIDVPEHLRRILETAWRLGGTPETVRFRRWAHALGFSGHVMTKSRRYSVTFLALRALRQAWRVAERGDVVVGEHSDELVWIFTGAGFRKAIDAILARTYWQGRARSRAEYWANWHEGTELPS
jgi:hypothetical protein